MNVQENMDLRLMDVVMAYIYGSLDLNIYLKVSEGLELQKANSPKSFIRSSYKDLSIGWNNLGAYGINA